MENKIYAGSNPKIIGFLNDRNKIILFAYGSLSYSEIKKMAAEVKENPPIKLGKGKAPGARRIFCNRTGLSGVATLIKDDDSYVLGTIYEFDPAKNKNIFIKILIREGQNFKKRKYVSINKQILIKKDTKYYGINVTMFVISQASLSKEEFKIAKRPSDEYILKVLEQLNQSGWKRTDGSDFTEIPNTGEIYGYEYNRVQYT